MKRPFHVPSHLDDNAKAYHVNRLFNDDWPTQTLITFEYRDGNTWGLRILSDMFKDSLESE